MTIYSRLPYLVLLCLLDWTSTAQYQPTQLLYPDLLNLPRDTIPLEQGSGKNLTANANNILNKGTTIELYVWPAVAQKAIQLRWAYPEGVEVWKFIIFRSKGKRPMTVYKIVSPKDLLTLPINETGGLRAYSFLDRDIQKNKVYHYQVVARIKEEE